MYTPGLRKLIHAYLMILMIGMLVVSLLGSPNRVQATAPATFYVAPNADCDGAAPCYGTPQAAVDAALPGSIIRIAEGSYPLPAGQDQVLHIDKSITLQGGYRITDWLTDPQPFAFPSILDPQHLGRGILIEGSETQPIQVNLEGIQIRNGQADLGGGLSATGAVVTMAHCVVSDNQATQSGGGIFLSNAASLHLSISRIINNTAGEMGGGIASHSSAGNTTLTRSWIFGNHAHSGGGGIATVGGQVKLETIMLVDNSIGLPDAAGAGLSADGTTLTLFHTTIAHNTGGTGSGLDLKGASALAATNSIIAGQLIGVNLSSAASSAAINGVLWGDGASWVNGHNTEGPGSVTISDAYTGDPLFAGLTADTLSTYYHLSNNSPAYNRALPTSTTVDIDGSSVAGGLPDLGADGYHNPNSSGSAVIHVAVETGGEIEVGTPDGVPESTHGAFFWNGSRWVTNDTAAHTYFTYLPTDERLMQYAFLADIHGSSPDETDLAGYQITRSTYTYSVPATNHGTYRITAAEYTITQPGSPEILLLRSRGNGYGQAYFEFYLQMVDNTTIAFRGGPAWFDYAESPSLAAQHPLDDPTGRAGTLTGCGPDADSRYWLDMNGGSDMGGITYYFHTAALNTRTPSLGSCFPDEVRLKFMEPDTNKLEEFRVRPAVYSETFIPNMYLPLMYR